jgi:hypothetical protein
MLCNEGQIWNTSIDKTIHLSSCLQVISFRKLHHMEIFRLENVTHALEIIYKRSIHLKSTLYWLSMF